MNKILSDTIIPRLPLNSVEEVESLLKNVCNDIQKDSTIIRLTTDYGGDASLIDDIQRQLDTATKLQFETYKKLNIDLLANTARELDDALQTSLNRMSEAVDRILIELRSSNCQPAALSHYSDALNSVYFAEKSSLESLIRSIMVGKRGTDIKSQIDVLVAKLFDSCKVLSDEVKSAYEVARDSSIREAVRRCADEISTRSEILLTGEIDIMSETDFWTEFDKLFQICVSSEKMLLDEWGCSQEECSQFENQVEGEIVRVRKNLLLVREKLNKIRATSRQEADVNEKRGKKRMHDDSSDDCLKRRRTVKLESVDVLHDPIDVPTRSERKKRQSLSSKSENVNEESTQSSLPSLNSFDSVAEQKRKAKEWFARVNSTAESKPSASVSCLNAVSPPELTPIEAAKIAAQQRIQSKVQSRVNELAHEVPEDGKKISIGNKRGRKSTGKKN